MERSPEGDEEELDKVAKHFDREEELVSRIDFAQINTFTKHAFSGNPAAVCHLPCPMTDDWMLQIAQEFNLPATAFVIKRGGKEKSATSDVDNVQMAEAGELDASGELELGRSNLSCADDEFDIRWFSTSAEFQLCGHGTLAAAHMLFSSGSVEGDTAIFHGQKGIQLRARKVSNYGKSGDEQDGSDSKLGTQAKLEFGKGVVELDFPMALAREVDDSEARVVRDTLGGVNAPWVGKTEMGDYLVELPSSRDVESLRPDLERMKGFGGRGCVYATARASGSTKFDIISRIFGPKIGIPEDQVTGSAHCTLGPYWAAKLGKDSLQAFQASPRGGEVFVRVDADAGRVYLHGGAVLVMAGTLQQDVLRMT